MKRYVMYSIALGFVWCFVHGAVNLSNFLIGAMIGPFLIRPFKELYSFGEEISYRDKLNRVPKQIHYFSILIVEIVKASIVVAKIVLQPKIDIKPGIIAVPIRAKTDVGITAIANTITLTPGTLTIDVSDDKSALYVHCIDIDNAKEIRDSIKDDLEEYVLEAFE
ncbi:Na+/H+ antiporter subunit E [Methanohalophilus halophilus]|uniref:Multisubunit sodium/proton antiporter, MrpE subunit n=1 Tax=Methanohalophilus halophilus TaxID=2177 RepID=A0A1L3Q4F8_9EURY|nr:Na+/H+ antiporter subunit E [Methanohalophilus halophilus]APH39767.1 Na+/H+ antiporter subunit E [Methanohalophilus halophilus]RNI08894.1 Na+/H+ antiporter subunit E [Methanohalophilus halophilus]SDW39560.1 multisubunit sodium/proton antiporter, MrpE subunit [Methanohalophilus halophilus]